MEREAKRLDYDANKVPLGLIFFFYNLKLNWVYKE
jgi:hypothetical protein